MPTVRDATIDDLDPLTAIYNHYIVHTPITFDLKEYQPEERRPWLEEHQPSGRHRLLVATDDSGILGYASTSRWRAKAAYDPTVETSVYVRHDAVGRGIGIAALWRAVRRDRQRGRQHGRRRDDLAERRFARAAREVWLSRGRRLFACRQEVRTVPGTSAGFSVR